MKFAQHTPPGLVPWRCKSWRVGRIDPNLFGWLQDHRAAIKLVKEACSGPARLVHIRRRPFPSQHGPQWEIRAAWRHEAYGHFPIFFLPD